MISALFWISICSIVVVIPTAIAARVLHEFSRYELEAYCRRRNRPELFDEVLDHHERCALGAEAFQWCATVCFLVSISFWYFSTSGAGSGGAGEIQLPGVAALIIWLASIAVAFVLINSWIPWAVVKFSSASFLFHTWDLWRIISRLAFPMFLGFSLIQFLAHRIAGKTDDDEDADEEALEEEIRTIVTAGERDGLLESPAREMIEGVINLDDIDVGEIMTPRSKMNALDISLPSRELIRQAIEFGHTRIPIYENEFENIIGILFVKDLLAILLSDLPNESANIRDYLRPVQFVPMSIHGDDLLQRFRESRSHLSVVVDEYESVMGVVTIEDVLEEIVGEITDELDKEEESELKKIDEATTEVVASIRIDDLNEHLKIDLPDTDDFDTLAGLVLTRLGRIPKVGEVIRVGNVKIEVHEASDRKIESFRIETLEDSDHEP